VNGRKLSVKNKAGRVAALFHLREKLLSPIKRPMRRFPWRHISA
jgi:hypothetical protein